MVSSVNDGTKAHLTESEQPGLLESLAAAAAQAEQQLEEGPVAKSLVASYLTILVVGTSKLEALGILGRF